MGDLVDGFVTIVRLSVREGDGYKVCKVPVDAVPFRTLEKIAYSKCP